MELTLLGMERTVVNVLLGDFTSNPRIHTEDEYNYYFKLIMALIDPKDLKRTVENLVGIPYLFSKGTGQKYLRETTDGEKVRVPEPNRTFERMTEIMAHHVITLFSDSDPEGFLRNAISQIKHIDDCKAEAVDIISYAIFVCTIMRTNVDLILNIPEDDNDTTTLYLIDRNGLV